MERATKRQKQLVLALWALSTLLPYFGEFVSRYAFGTCSWNGFGLFYYFAGFNGYLLLGHYIRHHVSLRLCYDVAMLVHMPAPLVVPVSALVILVCSWAVVAVAKRLLGRCSVWILG